MTKTRAVVLALLVASFAFLYKDVVAKLVIDWGADENYSHGFLVAPLAGIVVWRSRAAISALQVRPSSAGLLLIFVSLATLVVGTLGLDLLLPRLALLGTLAGSILFTCGRERLKKLGFPFLLLALAIPMPAIIFNQATLPLQLFASRFGAAVISACQIPVLREGNVITLATMSLEVVEACSGIRSLVSLLTLAVIWGYLTDSPSWLRWLLAASAVPIAIFANGIRVAGTGVAAHFIGPAAADGFLHTFSGWMIFVVAGVLLLAVHRLATWLVPPVPTRSAAGGVNTAGVEPAPVPPRRSDGIIARSLVVTACLVVTASMLGAMTRTEAISLRQPLSTLPRNVGAWESLDIQAFDARLLAVLRVDDYVNRAYVAPGRPWVGLYVGYYQSQRQGQAIHSPLNCMPGAGWQPIGRTRVTIPVPAGGGAPENHAEINRLIVQKGLDRQLVLYWYQAHGRMVASEYWGKIYTVVDAIRLNRSDGALVRVIVPISTEDAADEQAAERAALEFVSVILPALSQRLGG